MGSQRSGSGHEQQPTSEEIITDYVCRSPHESSSDPNSQSTTNCSTDDMVLRWAESDDEIETTGNSKPIVGVDVSLRVLDSDSDEENAASEGQLPATQSSQESIGVDLGLQMQDSPIFDELTNVDMDEVVQASAPPESVAVLPAFQPVEVTVAATDTRKRRRSPIIFDEPEKRVLQSVKSPPVQRKLVNFDAGPSKINVLKPTVEPIVAPSTTKPTFLDKFGKLPPMTLTMGTTVGKFRRPSLIGTMDMDKGASTSATNTENKSTVAAKNQTFAEKFGKIPPLKVTMARRPSLLDTDDGASASITIPAKDSSADFDKKRTFFEKFGTVPLITVQVSTKAANSGVQLPRQVITTEIIPRVSSPPVVVADESIPPEPVMNRDPRIGQRRMSASDIQATTGEAVDTPPATSPDGLVENTIQVRDPRLMARRMSASDIRFLSLNDTVEPVEPTVLPACQTKNVAHTKPTLVTDLRKIVTARILRKSRGELSKQPAPIQRVEKRPIALPFNADRRRGKLPPFLMVPKFSKYGIAILFPNLCLQYMAENCRFNEEHCPLQMKHKPPSSQWLRRRMSVCLAEDVGTVFTQRVSHSAKLFNHVVEDFCHFFGQHKMTDQLFYAADLCLSSTRKHYVGHLKHCIEGFVLAGTSYAEALYKTLSRIKDTDIHAAERNQVMLTLILDERNTKINLFLKFLTFFVNYHVDLFEVDHLNALLSINNERVNPITWQALMGKNASPDVNQKKLAEFMTRYRPLNM